MARRARRGRPGASRRCARRRRPDVHVGDDRRAEGRPDDASQPRRRGGDVAALGVRRRLGQPHAACRCSTSAASAGRSSGSGTARRRSSCGSSIPTRCSTRSSSRRVTNAVFVPTMLQMLSDVPGAARARLLGASVDRLRRLTDHHDRLEGGAAHVPAARCSGSTGSPRRPARSPSSIPADHDPDGPREHLLRSAGRPYPWVELRIVDPATGAHAPPREVGEVWLRAPNVMPRLLQPAGRDRRRAHRRRLAAHRRRRLRRRGRLPVPHRPDQGHDRVRRRERLPDRGRGGAVAAPRRARGGRDRRPGRALGRDRQGADRAPRQALPSTPTS